MIVLGIVLGIVCWDGGLSGDCFALAFEGTVQDNLVRILKSIGG